MAKLDDFQLYQLLQIRRSTGVPDLAQLQIGNGRPSYAWYRDVNWTSNA